MTTDEVADPRTAWGEYETALWAYSAIVVRDGLRVATAEDRRSMGTRSEVAALTQAADELRAVCMRLSPYTGHALEHFFSAALAYAIVQHKTNHSLLLGAFRTLEVVCRAGAIRQARALAPAPEEPPNGAYISALEVTLWFLDRVNVPPQLVPPALAVAAH